MDTELKDYLDSIVRTLQKDMGALRSDVNAQLRDLREEIRWVKSEMRGMSDRISRVGMDYDEGRRVSELRVLARVIGLEARVEALERRMSKWEGR